MLCFWFCSAPLIAGAYSRALLRSGLEIHVRWSKLRAGFRASLWTSAALSGGCAALLSTLVKAPGDKGALAGVGFAVFLCAGNSLAALGFYPAFRVLRGSSMRLRAFWWRFVTDAALLGLPVGTALVVIGCGRELIGEATTVEVARFGAACAVWALQWKFAAAFSLPGKTVPYPSRTAKERFAALAAQLGVPSAELVLLRTPGSRSAGAFALPGGRAGITDYLASALTEDELMAVCAHEIAHLKQRPGLQTACALQAVFAGAAAYATGYGCAAGFIGVLPAALCFVALVLVCFLPVLLIKQRNERDADMLAAESVGAEPLISALAKTYALNGRLHGTAAHGSLSARLERIRAAAGISPERANEITAAAMLLAA